MFSRAALLTVLLASLFAGAAFSQQLNITVSPRSTVHLDANQSLMNFTAMVTGGTPFPGQNASYNYQWSVQKGTACPGIIPAYHYQLPTLRYTPTSATANCIMVVQASDYLGNTTFGATGVVMVNPRLYSPGTLNITAYSIVQGQNSTVTMQAPMNGTPPYHYQWLAATSIGGNLSSTTANALCAVNPNTLNCVFDTSASTTPGFYEFELRYSDSSTLPPSLFSKSALIKVTLSNAPVTSTIAAAATSSASTSIPTSTATTSTHTTSVPTTTATQTTTKTTIPQVSIMKPNHFVSDGWALGIKWINTVLKYLV